MLSGLPYIPEYITVHLGAPSSAAQNVTISFPEYIKNIASSEIYPTWPANSLRANIYAIVTFALNRIYTEWYRSQGYNFDITSNTQYDQKFVRGRNYFDNVSQVVDELFNDYIRRQGQVQPMFSQFCNGTTVTCDGLSQWGTVPLAEEGYTPYEILKYYYGDDINIVFNAEVQAIMNSYDGTPADEGDRGAEVETIQRWLNRISNNYPIIPKVPVDGVYGALTEEAVIDFQELFNLTPDGIVGKSTWYRMAYIYTAVKRLAELNSEGLTFEEISHEYPDALRLGSVGVKVSLMQYYLSVISEFYDVVPPVEIDGVFGETTQEAVIAFQKLSGTTPDGIVGSRTWDNIYRYFSGIEDNIPIQYQLPPEVTGIDDETGLFKNPGQFPGYTLR